MGSYTDNPNNLGKFNSYVEQLPISAMVSVGQTKQAQYDQGIQKIQGQIDNIAGLDVMRDVDKQHLQSRLNDLGSTLKTVAARDFSNYQLTNSTAGMVNQIGKDPYIQNAVMSTQRVRTAISDKDTAKHTGKGSPENEWDLSNQVNGYLNDKNPGAMFSGGYNPYTDVNKKMEDVYGKLKEQNSDIEDPFQKDGKGNYVLDANGNKKFSPVMVETILKGNSSSQIANAIRASLDQNDLKQLDITGRYVFRGVSANDLKQDTFNTYTQHIKSIQDRIGTLQELAVVQSKNPTTVNDLNKTINELKADIAPDGYYAKQLVQAYHTIDINPEGIKSQLYKDKTIAAFADGYANETKAIKFLTNPYETVKEWGLDYEQRNVFHKDQMGVDYANIKLSQDRLTFEQNKYLAERTNTNPKNLGGLVPDNMDYYENVKNDVSTKTSQLGSIDDQLRNGLINEYKKLPGVTDDKVQAYKDSLTGNKLAAYIALQDSPDEKSKTSFPSPLRGLLVQRKEALSNLLDAQNSLKTATETVNNSPELKAKLAALPPVQITMPDGSSKILDPQEVQSTINNIDTKLDNAPAITGMLHSISKTLGPGKTNDFFNWVTKRLYTNMGGDLTKLIAEGSLQDLNIGGNFIANLVGAGKPFANSEEIDKWFNYVKYNLSSTELQVFNQMNHNEDNGIPFTRISYPDIEAHMNVHNDFMQKRNEALATLHPEYVPTWKEIDNKLIPKDVLRTTIGNIIASNVETSKGNSSYDKGSTEKLLKLKPEDLNFKVARNQNGAFLALSASGDASSTQMIPIGEELATHYGLPSDPNAKLIGKMMQNGGTTNNQGGELAGAYARHSTDKYTIGFDFKPDYTDNNIVYPFLLVQTRGGLHTYDLGDRVDLTHARVIANENYSNEEIEKLFKTHKIKLP